MMNESNTKTYSAALPSQVFSFNLSIILNVQPASAFEGGMDMGSGTSALCDFENPMAVMLDTSLSIPQ